MYYNYKSTRLTLLRNLEGFDHKSSLIIPATYIISNWFAEDNNVSKQEYGSNQLILTKAGRQIKWKKHPKRVVYKKTMDEHLQNHKWED